MVVGMEALGATGGASKARMPEMNAQRLCKDAKPAKHTQTLALRKVGGIVRGEGWYSNPSVLTAEKFSE